MSNPFPRFTFGTFSGPDLLPSSEPFCFTSRTVTPFFSSNLIRANIVISQLANISQSQGLDPGLGTRYYPRQVSFRSPTPTYDLHIIPASVAPHGVMYLDSKRQTRTTRVGGQDSLDIHTKLREGVFNSLCTNHDTPRYQARLLAFLSALR